MITKLCRKCNGFGCKSCDGAGVIEYANAKDAPMGVYLLDDTEPGGKLHLAFGEDACKAAKNIIAEIGGNPDVNRFSVSGSWNVGDVIDVSKWWPHFTNDPNGVTAIQIVRGMS